MKDYDKNSSDARPDSAPQKKLPVKPKETGAVDAAVQRSVSAARSDAGQSDAPAILQHEHLSHPANAGQLAGILNELQQSHGNAYVQQAVSGMNEPKPAVEAPANSTGQTLDGGVKAEMESAFDESFNDVRIHTGGEAQKMNDELGARAVTRGRDIYFNSSEYNPSTREGKELLAHELTHVIQQRGGSQSQTVNQEGDAFEKEAERNASAIMRGERPEVRGSGSAAPAFQRQAPAQPRPAAPPPPANVADFTVVLLQQRPSGDVGPVHFNTNVRPGARTTSAFIRLAMPQAMSMTPTPVQNIATFSTTAPSITRDKQEVAILVSLRPGGTPIMSVLFRQGNVRFTVEFHF
ncbi:MAG TPA: DUF4157 domain-containing protein [Pyrinomonadaceae bacterium]|nr:DUF4157 domain-containing protein [Pyrinomonadaceae bacterium]